MVFRLNRYGMHRQERGWLSVLVLVVAGEVGLVGVRVRVGVVAVAVLVSVLDVVVGVRAVRV